MSKAKKEQVATPEQATDEDVKAKITATVTFPAYFSREGFEEVREEMSDPTTKDVILEMISDDGYLGVGDVTDFEILKIQES